MTQQSFTPLRRLRLSRQLSLETVAKALKLNNGTLSRIERGRSTTPETAEALVRYYGGGITEMEILYPQRFMRAATRKGIGRAAQ